MNASLVQMVLVHQKCLLCVNNLTAGTTNGTLTANGETAAGTTATAVNSGGVGGVATVDFAETVLAVQLQLFWTCTIMQQLQTHTETFTETITIKCY